MRVDRRRVNVALNYNRTRAGSLLLMIEQVEQIEQVD